MFTLFCLHYKLEFLFNFDPTMMQDGGQDGHLNHVHDNYMEKWPLLQKAYLNVYFEPRHGETNGVVSEQARHKTSYTNTEDE